MRSFNFEILEYLGDSLLNFSLVRHLYFDTSVYHARSKWDYFQIKKLHEVKTGMSSNYIIALALYEQYYKSFSEENRQHFEQRLQEAMSHKKDSEKLTRNVAIRLPILYNDQHIEHSNQITSYSAQLFQLCATELDEKQDL